MSLPLITPVTQVDMSTYLENKRDNRACKAAAESLKKFGAVLIHDPRVVAADAETFLSMMERYFSQQRDKKLADARPHLFYQVRHAILQRCNTFDWVFVFYYD